MMETVIFSLTTEMTPKIDDKGRAFSLRNRDYEDPQCVAYHKTSHAKSKTDGQGWEEAKINDTLNVYDQGETRTPTVVVMNPTEKTVYDWHRQDTRMTECKDVCATASGSWGAGGNNMPYVLESNQNHATITNNGISTTLPASMGEGGGYVPMVTEEKPLGVDTYNQTVKEDVQPTIKVNGGGDSLPKVESNMIVRRLTPLECERLQGFPDGWTDIGEWTDSKGKKHKPADSPRYKALGNSIATPFWFYVLRRISAQYERPATLGSLFDGIGGFPLCWARCNGSGSAIWASEIEEFPIAVTKKHFGDGETPGDIQRYL